MVRWQVPVVLGAVVAGTVLGLSADVGDWSERLVVPALVTLLTLTFTGIAPAAFTSDVGPHRRVVASSLVLNFVWAPLAAGVLGWLLLTGSPGLRIGLVMLLVTPCTDWYLIFTATARGNVPLSVALLPVNLVLQLALLPVFIVVLTGTAADVPAAELVASVAVVLGIPLGLALAVRLGARRTGTTNRLDGLLGRLEPLGLALLALAITAIFATHARDVTDEPAALLPLLVALAIFFASTYLIAAVTARVGGFRHRERVTLTIVAMARNSPIALAIATTAFPDRPLIAVALVVGPLVELPVLSLAARALAAQERSDGTEGSARMRTKR
ncbi:bile acid:sodium symporter [soil metagenome]